MDEHATFFDFVNARQRAPRALCAAEVAPAAGGAGGGGSAGTGTGAGGAGGINIFNAGGDDSGLADAMKIFSGGRSGMDSVVQAMSQSGKGN